MKILFLPNWTVSRLTEDDQTLQLPDKQVSGEKYWFFRYFPPDTTVDIIDIHRNNCLHRLEKKIKFYIWQGILAFVGACRYDAVISHSAQSGLTYSLLSAFRRKGKRPLHVIIDVGGMNGARNGKTETSFVKLALTSRPAIIYHASIQKKMYEKIYKNVVRKSRFIRFGANINEFRPLGLAPKNYVLSFGYAKRDYPTLLRAWKQVETDVRLYIVGSDSIISSGRVNVMPKTNILELKRYIAESLFVVIPLPYFRYSYGQMSALQSMAMGKPVIVTKTPSTIDYIEDGRGAFFVEPYDDKDMKEKIQYLLNNRERLETIGAEACSYIRHELTEEKMADEIYHAIQEFFI
jgi:glycosyltransferase involved in cell wall biosynthesis